MLTCFWVLVLSQLPSSMIMLDPTEVGQVDRAPLEVKEKEKAARAAVRRGELWLGTHGRLTQGSMLPRQAIEAQKIIKIKKKTRGRSRTSRRAAKKQANVVTQQKVGAMGSKGSMGSMRRHRFMAHSACTRCFCRRPCVRRCGNNSVKRSGWRPNARVVRARRELSRLSAGSTSVGGRRRHRWKCSLWMNKQHTGHRLCNGALLAYTFCGFMHVRSSGVWTETRHVEPRASHGASSGVICAATSALSDSSSLMDSRTSAWALSKRPTSCRT